VNFEAGADFINN